LQIRNSKKKKNFQVSWQALTFKQLPKRPFVKIKRRSTKFFRRFVEMKRRKKFPK